MDLRFQRLVDRFAGVPICGALSAVDWVRRRAGLAPEPRPPQRILIVLLSEMGSLVLGHSMFTTLRARYPNADLHALVFRKNRDILDLMQVLPAANVVTIDDASLSTFARDGLHALRRLRALRPDVVIDCELFSRVSSIIAYLSGAPERVGFHPHTQEGLYRGSFMTRPVLYNPYRHVSRQFLALVAAIGSTSTPTVKTPLDDAEPGPPPHAALPQDELADVAQRLRADFPGVAGRDLVLVYPGGGILGIRAWPIASYVQVCRALLSEGYAVAVIGLGSDKPLARTLVSACGDAACVDLTGYTASVRHLLALFHAAKLLIANDGGPGQFAALTPLRSIVFFGPETPALYGSLATNAESLYLGLPCSPCLTAYNHRSSPCDGDNQCLKQITPDQVLTAARRHLRAATDGLTA